MSRLYSRLRSVTFRLALMALSTVLLTACESTSSPPTDVPAPARTAPDVTAVDERVAAGYTDFGFDLFRTLVREEPDANIFYSPASLAFALGMVYHGAEGETRTELASALGLDAVDLEAFDRSNAAWLEALLDAETDVELSIANSVWIREGFAVEPEFVTRNEEVFRAVVETRDFGDPATVDEINRWAAQETQGRIEEILEAIDPLDVLYLINATYFLGEWTEPFAEEGTVPGRFTRADGSVFDTPFMTRTDTIAYHEGEGWEAVRLPYGEDERFAMVVVVPDHDSGLDELYTMLDATGWDTVLSGFEPTFIELALPRFTLEWEETLNEALQTLGVKAAFDPARSDFSGINPDADDLHMSEVLQKTFVQVNEKGTEAAAVTSIGASVTSAPLHPIVRVDRPFVSAIVDTTTGTTLFLGQITDPKDPEWEGTDAG